MITMLHSVKVSKQSIFVGEKTTSSIYIFSIKCYFLVGYIIVNLILHLVSVIIVLL